MSRLGAPGLAPSTIGGYALVVGQALRTLILARLLGPATFGILNAANVAASFTPQSDFGCGRIGEQYASEARGRRDEKAVEAALLAAAGARIAPAGIVAALLLAAAGMTWWLGGSGTAVLVLLFIAVSAPCQAAWWAVMGWLRVHGRFRRLAYGQVSQVAVWLAVTPLAAWQFGLPGAMAAMASSFLPPIVIGGRGLPLGRLLRPRWWAFRRLVRPGIPVWLIFAGTFLFTNIDQLVAALSGGPEWLGYLSLATLTAASLVALPDGAAAAAHPRTLEHFAEHGGLGPTTPSVVRVMHLVQLAFAAVVPLSWLAMALLTTVFLPQYGPALPLVVLLGVAASLVGTTTASNSALLAVGLHRRIPALLGLATVIRGGSAVALIGLGLGLTAIGVAAILAAFLFALVYLGLVARALGLEGRRALLFRADHLFGSALLLLAAVPTVVLGQSHGLSGYAGGVASALLVTAAGQWLAWRWRSRAQRSTAKAAS